MTILIDDDIMNEIEMIIINLKDIRIIGIREIIIEILKIIIKDNKNLDNIIKIVIKIIVIDNLIEIIHKIIDIKIIIKMNIKIVITNLEIDIKKEVNKKNILSQKNNKINKILVKNLSLLMRVTLHSHYLLI